MNQTITKASLKEKVKSNKISVTQLANLFKLDRTMLSKAINESCNYYSNHLPVIEKYVDEVALINDKYRRL